MQKNLQDIRDYRKLVSIREAITSMEYKESRLEHLINSERKLVGAGIIIIIIIITPRLETLIRGHRWTVFKRLPEPLSDLAKPLSCLSELAIPLTVPFKSG
jgi:hypothetical protein